MKMNIHKKLKVFKKFSKKEASIIILLVIAAVYFSYTTYSVAEYNQYCQNNPFSYNCLCATPGASIWGRYNTTELDGMEKKFHGDIWIQNINGETRLVQCMRSYVNILQDCGTRGYTGTVNSFQCNPEPTPNMREIPRDANTMWFPDYKVNRGDIDYGEPEFRGHGINSTHRD